MSVIDPSLSKKSKIRMGWSPVNTNFARINNFRLSLNFSIPFELSPSVPVSKFSTFDSSWTVSILDQAVAVLLTLAPYPLCLWCTHHHILSIWYHFHDLLIILAVLILQDRYSCDFTDLHLHFFQYRLWCAICFTSSTNLNRLSSLSYFPAFYLVFHLYPRL